MDAQQEARVPRELNNLELSINNLTSAIEELEMRISAALVPEADPPQGEELITAIQEGSLLAKEIEKFAIRVQVLSEKVNSMLRRLEL